MHTIRIPVVIVIYRYPKSPTTDISSAQSHNADPLSTPTQKITDQKTQSGIQFTPFLSSLSQATCAIGIFRERLSRCIPKALKDTLTSGSIIQAFKAAGLYSQVHLDLILLRLQPAPTSPLFPLTELDPENFEQLFNLTSPPHIASLETKACPEDPVLQTSSRKRLQAEEYDTDDFKNDSTSSDNDDILALKVTHTRAGRIAMTRSLYSPPPVPTRKRPPLHIRKTIRYDDDEE